MRRKREDDSGRTGPALFAGNNNQSWVIFFSADALLVIAVSSATTSTLVVDADEIPQYIEGIIEGLGGVVDEGARRGR